MRLVAIVTVLLALPTLTQADEPWHEEHGCAHAKAARAQALVEAWGLPGEGLGLRDEFATDTDVLHYELDLAIDPIMRLLDGVNTMTVRSEVDGLAVFRVNLRDVFTISDLSIDGAPLDWVRLDPATVEVTLDRGYNVGESFDLRVAYDGRPVSGGSWGSIVFRRRGEVREVWTLSQPWWAHTWWPCKEVNTDKATADLIYTVPADMVVASNGALLSVDDVGVDQKRYHWRTDYQTAPYLFAFSATNYTVHEWTWDYDGGSMPLVFYVYPEEDHDWLPYFFDELDVMLDVFSELYGPYPFVDEKYGICQVGFGGGMEHQTMTSQGFLWLSWLNAHELSHQWWGDSVTCATWHDIWLNEGFAVYSEALWLEHQPGSSGKPALLEAMNDRRPNDPMGTVYVYDISDMNRVFDYQLTYLKASWVMHMLRHVLGDETFFDVLALYRALHEGGTATTEQFQNVCETVSGLDLAAFFAQWIYNPDLPRYMYAWREHSVDGQPYVELCLRQHGFNPVFTMPIDIVTTSGGQPSTHVVLSDERTEHLLFAVDAAPVDDLQLDPEHWILTWGDPVSMGFAEGPPKVVALTPAPGAVLSGPEVPKVEIVFHKDVVVGAADFTLVGDNGGPVAVTFAYDPNRPAVTLTPTEELSPDRYTLTVFDTVVDVASQQALDGELADPADAGALPSGDGLPGGAAVVRFRVAASSVTGDLNCDGDLDEGDIDAFVLALWGAEQYYASHPDCNHALADMNGDGEVGFGDINPFAAQFME